MPRNSSGTYSLYTPGNPVVTNTVISSTWANNSLADIASALTDSLSRTGDGGMQAPLELDDGAIGAPAITWASETTSGWWRDGAGTFKFSVSAATALTVTSTGLDITGKLLVGAATGGFQGAGTINAKGVYVDGVALANSAGANPAASVGLAAVNGVATTFLRSDGAPALSQAILPTWTGTHIFSKTGGGAAAALQLTAAQPAALWTQTGASADEQKWQVDVSAKAFRGFTVDAADSAVRNWINVARGTGVAITSLSFGNATDNNTFSFLGTGATAFGGSGAFTGDLTFTVSGTSYSAGYRGMPSRSISSSDSTAALDNGRTVLFTGAGSQTFTVDSDFGTAGNVMVILNGGTGSLSIAESLSGTMTWLNGSGTLSTGSRTLAIGGVATIWMVDANNAYIWGTGLS